MTTKAHTSFGYKQKNTKSLKTIILGDLPSGEFQEVWAKKINNKWLIDSPALTTEIPSLDTEFYSVGTCEAIKLLKEDYLKHGQSLEQLAIDFVANLNAGAD